MIGVQNTTFRLSKNDVLTIMAEMGVKTFEQLCAKHALLTGFPLSANSIRNALRDYEGFSGSLGENLSCKITSMYRLYLKDLQIEKLKQEAVNCKELQKLF